MGNREEPVQPVGRVLRVYPVVRVLEERNALFILIRINVYAIDNYKLAGLRLTF